MCTLLSIALVHPRPAAAAPPPPRLEDVLAQAGQYVSRLEDDLTVLVASESYAQSLLTGRGSAINRRSLASDVAWVQTRDPMVWAFFRDVREVDGRPVRDREDRLEQLFHAGLTPAGLEHVQQILEESSRYNLGTRRTVNSPTVALSFLHSRNQPLFAFVMLGPEKKERVATWKLRLEERSRPTLIRTFRGDDVPSRGLMWIDTGRGALVASRLELSPLGTGPVSIETLYAPDERIGFWLPARMWENLGSRSERRVEAVARYSNWRRAQIEVQIVLPGR